jgi:hypothetical protein
MVPQSTPIYFELSQHDLAHLPPTFGPFESRLLSSLVGIFKTSLSIHPLKSSNEPLQISTSTISGKAMNKFINSAAKDHFNGDKFISLRLLGPSLQYITAEIPLTSMVAKEKKDIVPLILQLCIWRTFAVGSQRHLRELKFTTNPQAMTTNEITEIVTSWIANKKLYMSVYGNLMIDKDKVKKIVEKLWELAEFLALGVMLVDSVPSEIRRWAFSDVYEQISTLTIPFIPRGGILIWLLSSDFSEYQICDQPTVDDLANHIAFAKTSGPLKALKLVRELSGKSENEISNRDGLAKVRGVFEDPPLEMVGLREIVDDCEAVQGRKLNMVDLEHGLCKITRMIDMMK